MTAKQTKSDWTILGLTGVAIVAATATVAPAQVRIVAPSSVANVEGDGNVTSTGGPGRVQYLIPASDFAGLPETHRLLVSWNFRGDASQSESVDWAFDEKVWMSTTNKDSLTSVFDDNHGPDKTLVHDGTISYPILASGPAEGPRDFADGTPLQTPFFYDPAKGNLLIDEIALQNSVPFPGPHLDIQTTAEARVLVGGATKMTGALYSGTPVIQLVFLHVVSRLAGDYDNDGIVDAADYVVWRKGLGTTYTQADYDVWRAHFGQTAGSGAGDLVNEGVPEPPGLVMLIAIMAWSGREKRILRKLVTTSLVHNDA